MEDLQNLMKAAVSLNFVSTINIQTPIINNNDKCIQSDHPLCGGSPGACWKYRDMTPRDYDSWGQVICEMNACDETI